MRISTKVLFSACYGKYAITAVNIFTMEQALGLFMAAQDSDTPIIVQITPAARNYAHPKMLRAMIQGCIQNL
jgi:fructose-bisphosphate aldolase class II